MSSIIDKNIYFYLTWNCFSNGRWIIHWMLLKGDQLHQLKEVILRLNQHDFAYAQPATTYSAKIPDVCIVSNAWNTPQINVIFGTRMRKYFLGTFHAEYKCAIRIFRSLFSLSWSFLHTNVATCCMTTRFSKVHLPTAFIWFHIPTFQDFLIL